MDALKMSAINCPGPAGSSDSTGLEIDETALTRRIKSALTVLLGAREYSSDLDTNLWDFAVEISTLRRLQLSNSELRWLVVRGLVEHAIETKPRHNDLRSFRHVECVAFDKRSCFVLTETGTALARALHAKEPDKSVGALVGQGFPNDLATLARVKTPAWDRDRRELRLGGALVKRFTIPSPDQESVLSVFEEYNWPARIEDPLPPCDEDARKARLQSAIERLNDGQKQPLLRFSVNGNGEEIRWEVCGGDAEPRDA